jgi:hypothetical protein
MRFILLCISLVLFSCNKEKDNSIDPSTKASFYAIVNGKEISCKETGILQNIDSSVIWNPSWTSHSSTDKTFFSFELYLGGLMYDSFPKNTISIDFIIWASDSQIDTDGMVTKQVFDDVFSTGNKLYSKGTVEDPGILIKWYDSNRHKWTANDSNNGNSSFKVIKSVSVNPVSPLFKYSKYLEISFNCNLYDINGDSIIMTNASFKGIYSMLKKH